LKLGYCPQCVTATLAAKRQSGSDLSMSLIAARSIRYLWWIGGWAENRGAASGSAKSAR